MLNLLIRLLTMTRQGKIRGSARLSRRLRLTAQQPLIKIVISLSRLAVGGLTRDRIRAIYTFTRAVITMHRSQGQRGLVLWLKAAHVATMKSLPGSTPMQDTRELGAFVSLSRSGIPRLIPPAHRLRMRRGDPTLFRFWLTLFGLYRALKFPAEVKVSTITQPGVVLSTGFKSSWATWVKTHFVPGLEKLVDEPLAGGDPAKMPAPELLPLAQAGACSQPRMSSYSSAAWAAYVWVTGYMHTPGAAHKHRKIPPNWGESLPWYLYYIGQYEGTKSLWTTMQLEAKYDPRGYPFAGRLATKLEAAGKVRVFAMVDYWTQVALKPLHDTIFGWLRDIPQDGTFDQHKPVKALLNRKLRSDGYIASFDLSAATDRLPVQVQESILAVLYGHNFAKAWRSLLVERTYSMLPPTRDRPSDPIHLWDESDHYRYAVGQPMGAYSSWAMLALTHHALVQFAAWRAGVKGWFKDYAVLGDDVVIGNRDVANHYLRVMEILGVEVGLAKSLVSNSASAEFAKRLYLKGQDISGLPWNLWLMAQQSLSACVAMCQWVSQGWQPPLSQAMAAFGVGMKNMARLGGVWESLPRRLRALLVILTHPLCQTAYSRTNWLEWAGSRGPSSPSVWGDEASTWVTPWLDSVVEDVVKPCEEIYDRGVADVFFGPHTASPSRLDQAILTKANAALVVLERRIGLVLDTRSHLQRLGISLQARQISALVYQEIRKLENAVAEIPLLPRDLQKASSGEENPRFTDLYVLWESIRARGMRTFGQGVPPGIPRVRPSSLDGEGVPSSSRVEESTVTLGEGVKSAGPI
jgi:hypothetical protein